MDVMVDIPGIQEEFDALETLTELDEIFEGRVELIRRIWVLDSEMGKWSELARSEANSSPYWPEFSLVDNAADDPQLGKVFPIAYRVCQHEDGSDASISLGKQDTPTPHPSSHLPGAPQTILL